MTETIKLAVCAPKLVAHMRHAFTNKSQALAELMQNARRAGATQVAFAVNEKAKTLAVRDNGCGLEDFQALFTIAESGWDSETQAEERPYGIGFLAALYAAERVTIKSAGRRTVFLTEDLLAFKPITVEPWETEPGLWLFLDGWSLTEDDTLGALCGYARGFPIQVLCNRKDLPRPDAIDGGRTFAETEVGFMSIADIEAPLDPKRVVGTLHTRLYLQGLPVGSHRHWCGAGENVVHLDSRQFTGRMPDRNVLIDHDQAETTVHKVIARAWNRRIAALKAEWPPEDFARGVYATAEFWQALHVLDDVPYLPPQVLSVADAYPLHRMEWQDGNSQYAGPPIPQAEIETGAVKIVALECHELGDGVRNWAPEMYAWLHQATVLKDRLGPGHWIWKSAVDINAEAVRVALEGQQPAVTFNGNILWDEVVIPCQQYTMDGPLGKTEPSRTPWYGCLVASDPPTLLYPESSDYTEVVRQVDDFWDGDEERFLETEIEREGTALDRFMASQRPGEATTVFLGLLRDADLTRYPGLCGQRFEVEILSAAQGGGGPDIRVRYIGAQEAA